VDHEGLARKVFERSFSQPLWPVPILRVVFADDKTGVSGRTSLYTMKAVLNGRGDEIIDLAKTNLFR
jgi:hypothetical protein